MTTLTIGRGSLDLPALAIGSDPGAGMYVDKVGNPDFTFRYTYAPDSQHVPGSQLLAAVLEASSLPAVVYVQAASSAALETLKNELAAAVSQFSYTLTLTVDGVARSWQADPTWPQWGTVDSGMVAQHMASTSLVIPVNPAGA